MLVVQIVFAGVLLVEDLVVFDTLGDGVILIVNPYGECSRWRVAAVVAAK